MSTKNISLVEEAYRALLREKGKKESFSDVVLKLTYRRGKLMDSFGKWKISEKDVREIEKELKHTWSRWK